MLTLSNETISAWETETRKHHAHRKIEFKPIKDIGKTEFGATADEECEEVRCQSGNVLNECSSNWYAHHGDIERMNLKETVRDRGEDNIRYENDQKVRHMKRNREGGCQIALCTPARTTLLNKASENSEHTLMLVSSTQITTIK